MDNLPSGTVAMQGFMAQCPYCQQWIRIQPDKYGTATVYSRCRHFVECTVSGDQRHF